MLHSLLRWCVCVCVCVKYRILQSKVKLNKVYIFTRLCMESNEIVKQDPQGKCGL